MRGRCAAMRLERALAASATAAGAALAIAEHRTTAWHSATFAGDRHELDASAVSGERLDKWLERLPALDLPVPGHVLADLAVTRRHDSGGITRFRINGLTVVSG